MYSKGPGSLVVTTPGGVVFSSAQAIIPSSALRLTFYSTMRKKEQQPAVTLTHLLHDDINTLLNAPGSQDKSEALNNLTVFLSIQRDRKYYIDLEKKLKPIRTSFTRELHLFGTISSITQSVIAEIKLKAANRKHGFNREEYWQRLMSECAQAMRNRKTNAKNAIQRQDVQVEMTNLVEKMGIDFAPSTSLAIAENEKIELSRNLVTYLKFKMEQESLVDTLLVEGEEVLGHYRDSQVSDFVAIDEKTYVEGHIQQRLALFEEERKYFASTENPTSAAEETASLKDDLKEFLACQIKDRQLVQLLQDEKFDRAAYLEQQEKKYLELDNAFAEIKEPSIIYDNAKYKAQHVISHHPRMRAVENPNSPRVIKLVDQEVDVLLENNKEQNALDLALKTKNTMLIAQVLAYAKHAGVLEELLHNTLLKLARNENRSEFLTLIGGACIFEPENKGLFNPKLVESIRQNIKPNGRLFGGETPNKRRAGDIFSGLFNSKDEVVLSELELDQIYADLLSKPEDPPLVFLIKHANDARWPSVHAAIEQRYVCNDAPQIPASVWQALKEKQKYSERFEKLAHFFDKAVEYVVTQYKKNPEHYGRKVQALLTILNEYAEKEMTLTLAVERIADALQLSNGGISTWSRSWPSFNSETKTQKLVLKATCALESVALQTTSPSARYPSKEELSTVLAQTAGSAEEQRERRQRAVIVRSAFKTTLRYLEAQCKKIDAQAEHTNAQKISLAKKAIMDNLLNQYIKKEIQVDEFIRQFEAQLNPAPNKSETTLITKKNRWQLFPPKSARYIQKEWQHNKAILLTGFELKLV